MIISYQHYLYGHDPPVCKWSRRSIFCGLNNRKVHLLRSFFSKFKKGEKIMKGRLLKRICMITAVGFFCSGCATIIHGTTQNVSINSNPPGAKASIDGLKIETPNSVTLARNKDYIVNVEKEGYKPGQAQITRKFDGLPVIAGNILWLLPGVLVDILAGGAWNLTPEQVNVTLAQE